MAPKTNTGNNTHLTSAYALSSPTDAATLYDSWAAVYNADMSDPSQNYVAPLHVATALQSTGIDLSAPILDAGCGTGLSGLALAKAGARVLDGWDISPGMLKEAAQTGVYRDLKVVDLTRVVEAPDEAYAGVACVGTLTHGHVGPVPALGEFVRLVKQGGVVVATVLDDLWVEGGFEKEVDRLKSQGRVEVLGLESMDYRKGAGVSARVLILKKV